MPDIYFHTNLLICFFFRKEYCKKKVVAVHYF